MLNIGTLEDEKIIFEYIGKDYGKCAYLYIDLKKYGFENDNVTTWYQTDDMGNLNVIVLRYYNGMHIYSKTNEFDYPEVGKLVNEMKPALVCGMKETIDKVFPFVRNYTPEYGKVLRLENYSGIASDEVYQGTRDELKEVAELLMTDEEMGAPYGFDLLYKQLVERYDEGFGRNWIRRDEQGILSHCATYAELEDIAVISGGIVRIDKRGKGEYPGQLGAMCKDLYNENKEVISYYYGGAKSAHKKVGFEILGDWEKLILNEA